MGGELELEKLQFVTLNIYKITNPKSMLGNTSQLGGFLATFKIQKDMDDENQSWLKLD